MHYRYDVSYQWQRRTLLRRFRAGQVPREELCDADFLLVTAARFHGHPAPEPCPVCGSLELRVVRWVHGEDLGRRSGTARTEEEIAALVAERGEVTVHTVEVCPACRWNHLVRSATAAPGEAGSHPAAGG
ncbi:MULTISPECIES: DUF5318 family protein [unclassified Corynebacterium]|uniref:DUF5318 family protein n=1 Tax=unclassified Corynebacterium TaxID=2624378 RepID=UPI00128B9976|nr:MULTISPECIES: DUF5318 family protein [unclassified Corynebacterium]